jgi:hypothetical protein
MLDRVMSFLLILCLTVAASAGQSHVKPCELEFCRALVSLPEGSAVSRDFLKSGTVNGVAEAVISRIRSQELLAYDVQSSPVHVPIDLATDTEIMLFFWLEDLPSIEARGFLNQHQIGKSNGTLNPQSRLVTENNVLGLNLGEGELEFQLRPKSAFLNVLTPVNLGPKVRAIVSDEAYDPPSAKRRGGYGNVAAVFKRTVLSRALWTVDDSWWLGMTQRSDRELLPLRGTFDRHSLPKMKLTMNSYFEALIYGSLTIADVDHFITLNEVVVPALSLARKPVYLAVRSQEYDRYVFRRTKLLYTPK